jgi:hypothetical protein
MRSCRIQMIGIVDREAAAVLSCHRGRNRKEAVWWRPGGDSWRKAQKAARRPLSDMIKISISEIGCGGLQPPRINFAAHCDLTTDIGADVRNASIADIFARPSFVSFVPIPDITWLRPR